jgi:hypothetical protein
MYLLVETEFNLDPDQELITDQDPKLLIISDPAGSGYRSGSSSTTQAGNYMNLILSSSKI